MADSVSDSVVRIVSPVHDADPVSEAIGRELTRILAAGSRTVADDLRRELAALDGACKSMLYLAESKLIPVGDNLWNALTDLQMSRNSTVRALAALESFGVEPESPAIA